MQSEEREKNVAATDKSLPQRLQAVLSRLWTWTLAHLAMLLLMGILLAAALLATILVGGYLGWTWVGVTANTSPRHPQGTDYRPAKTLWDWLQLLIIPAVLAVAGYWFNTQQNRRQREASDRQREREQELAQDAQREDLLATYFDRLSDLLLKGELSPPSDGSEEKGRGPTVARAHTLATLRRLDAERKGNLVRFLEESGLVTGDNPIIDLTGADLTRAPLVGSGLHGAHLGAAHLDGADLRGADLDRADLRWAHLDGADLRGAHLGAADLSWAHLDGADLDEAHLRWAHLDGADLRAADLRGARLRGAKYDSKTQWPSGFKPDEAGAIKTDAD